MKTFTPFSLNIILALAVLTVLALKYRSPTNHDVGRDLQAVGATSVSLDSSTQNLKLPPSEASPVKSQPLPPQEERESASGSNSAENPYRSLMISLGTSSLSIEARVELLNQGVTNADLQTRQDAVFALGELGSSAGSAVPNLMKTLQDPDRDTRLLTIRALSRIGPEAKAAVPLLEKALGESDLALDAAHALWSVDKNSALTLEIFKANVLDRNGNTAHALGEMGVQANSAVSALWGGTTSLENNVRLNSLEALWKIDRTQSPNLVSPLIEVLTGEKTHPFHLKLAAKILSEIGPVAQAAEPVLRQLSQSADLEVRAIANQAIQKVSPSP